MRIRVWKARATCSANYVRVAPERSSFNWNDSTKRNAEIQCVAVVCDHVGQEALRVESENWADGRVVTEQSIGVGEAMNETRVRVIVSLDNGLDLGEELASSVCTTAPMRASRLGKCLYRVARPTRARRATSSMAVCRLGE